MSVTFAERVDSEERTQLLQWGMSLLAVLAVHIGVAFWLLPKDTPSEPPKPPPAAYLDLPPLPLPGAGGPPGASLPKPAQTKIPTNLPPAPPVVPQPVAPTVLPPKPPEPAPLPKIVVPPAATPQAVLPKTPPPKPPKPQAAQPQQPKPKVPAAPVDQTPSLTGSAPIVRLSAVGAWQASVVAQITSLKKWPPEAVQMKLTGSVILFIRIDRMGNILEYGIRRSSGYALLDRATIDMARRAVKLAPLPADISGQDYGFNLSIDWF